MDVGFWGGIIPGNHLELPKLVNHGVVGFKCFLCPSGVDEFPVVTEQDVELAYEQLNGSDGLIAVMEFIKSFHDSNRKLKRNFCFIVSCRKMRRQ